MIQRACSVVLVEWLKLASQFKARIVLAACVLTPIAFAAIIRLQSSLPEDTLFGRSVKQSGFALPLVVLGFAALWAFPVLGSIVGGDLFSSEDRYGTWTVLLTRSVSRGEIFAGKTVAALGFATFSVSILAASSIAAGIVIIGAQPLVSLSGVLLPPDDALRRVVGAWLSVLPATFAVTALALLTSIATRSTVAGIAVPVAIAMGMQLLALVDGPEAARRLLVTSGFGGWHGLLADPQYLGPLIDGTIVSAVYFVGCLAIAYRTWRQRDVGR